MSMRRFFQIVKSSKVVVPKEFYTPRFTFREEDPKRQPPVEGIRTQMVDGDRGLEKLLCSSRKWMSL